MSSWLPAFLKVPNASWLYFTFIFFQFVCDYNLSFRALLLGLDGIHMVLSGLMRQYNVSCRMSTLPRTLGLMIFVETASQEKKKSSLHNLTFLCLKVPGQCIPEWIILTLLDRRIWRSGNVFVFLTDQRLEGNLWES